MDISNYSKTKDSPNNKLTHVGGTKFALMKAQYNPETGEAMEPQTEIINREQVQKTRDSLAASIASCDTLLADMDAQIKDTTDVKIKSA